jgi:hypothetical protein
MEIDHLWIRFWVGRHLWFPPGVIIVYLAVSITTFIEPDYLPEKSARIHDVVRDPLDARDRTDGWSLGQ